MTSANHIPRFLGTWDIDQERERTDAATAQRGGPVGGRAPPNRPGIAALQRQQRQSLPNRAAAAPRTRSGVSVLQQSPLQQSGSAPPMGEPGHKGKGKGRAKDQSFTIFQDPTEE